MGKKFDKIILIVLLIVVVCIIAFRVYAFQKYGNLPITEIPAWVAWLFFGGGK